MNLCTNTFQTPVTGLAALLTTTLIAAALSGCTGDARGIVFTERGVTVQTPANARSEMTERIATAIAPELGPHWRSQIAISELPEWQEPPTETEIGDFRWHAVTVQVDLIGSGQTPAPATAAISQLISGQLKSRLYRNATSAITVTPIVDPSRFGYVAGAGSVPAPAPVRQTPVSEPGSNATPTALVPVHAAWPKQYVVQPDDTLSDISVVFYGTATKWRLIVDGNPGLNPASMKVGDVLVIPKPE